MSSKKSADELLSPKVCKIPKLLINDKLPAEPIPEDICQDLRDILAERRRELLRQEELL